MNDIHATKRLGRNAPTLLSLIVPCFIGAALAGSPTRAGAETSRVVAPLTRSAFVSSKLGPLPVQSFGRTPVLRRAITPPARYRKTQLTVEVHGSFSILPEGEVTISRSGNVVAEGALTSEIEVSGSSAVSLSITVTRLVDEPRITLTGVALPSNGGELTVPVHIETGLVRALAYQDGRRIAGVVRLYRIDGTTGQAEAESCGSMGAVGSSQEISAGRYLAVMSYRGAVLSKVVEVTPGSSRLIRLEG